MLLQILLVKLLSLSSVQDVSVIYILLEIGSTLETFVDDKHLCSKAGLTSQSNENACKNKSVRISCTGVYIKPLLVQCSISFSLKYYLYSISLTVLFCNNFIKNI